MIIVKDLLQNEEALTDFNEFTRVRKVNGEKTVSMTVIPSGNNEYSYPMVEEESTVIHDDEEYIIKKMSERSVGKRTIKRIDAVHKFYVDLINKQQSKIHNGSITFNNYMNLVFDGTGYSFLAEDAFGAEEFENLGNDTRLALLAKGLERFEAELELVGTQVRFKKRIGNDTDFQFRYGHNIKTIERSVDTTNLTTIIHGKWKDGTELTYRSPNADIFGEIEAPLFTDERFKSKSTRLEAMKKSLNDTPEFSIIIDFADLRAAGYPYTVPNEGDSVFVIYEPMNDLLIETRILEINEKFDANLKPIKTTVTLANYKKTFAGTMFNNVQKQLRKITNDDGMIKYDVLDEAVRIATEALQSAQTELIFDNGIIARDKNDPNKIVLFNSAGIGISEDGGQTFNTAMTGEGVVADVITAGILRGIVIQGVEINGSEFNTIGSSSDVIRIVDGTLVSKSGDDQTTLNSGTFEIKTKYSNGYGRLLISPQGFQFFAGETEDSINRYLGNFTFAIGPNYSDWVTKIFSTGEISTNDNMYANDFITNSTEDIKQDIEKWEENILEVIKNADLCKYRLRADVEKGIDHWKYGFVLGQKFNTPGHVLSDSGSAIAQYSMNSLSIKGIKDLITENEQRKVENEQLKSKIAELKTLVSELTNRIVAIENAK
ncbi:phage tail protein [Ornithinibacillus xuwenensis]|uniref:Phage tail protein n=1 Tax=Ornithinibacillus xuwenensis TaxID=3144668 RepID=A0ABU9XFP5_9BACI